MPHSHRRRMKKGLSSKQRKEVKQIIVKDKERKVIDQTENATNITASAPFNMLLGMPAQGDDDNQRIGDSINSISMRYRGELSLNANATEGASIRILALRLPATNVDGTSPIADFTGLKPNNFLPRQTPYQYKVLKDFVVNLGVGDKNRKIIKFSLSAKEKIQFDGDLATDIASHRFYVLGLTTHATNSELQLDMDSRFTYQD